MSERSAGDDGRDVTPSHESRDRSPPPRESGDRSPPSRESGRGSSPTLASEERSGRSRRTSVVIGLGALVLLGVVVSVTGLPFSAVCASPPPPAFDFAETDTGEATTVDVTYVGGMGVPAGRLRLVTAERNVTWAALAANTSADERIPAGESVTLAGLSEGTRLRVGAMVRDTATGEVEECWDRERVLRTYDVYEVGTGEVSP